LSPFVGEHSVEGEGDMEVVHPDPWDWGDVEVRRYRKRRLVIVGIVIVAIVMLAIASIG